MTESDDHRRDHAQLMRIYRNDQAAAQAWLDTPHMLLSGERARDLFETEEGRKRVEKLLNEIESGFVV